MTRSPSTDSRQRQQQGKAPRKAARSAFLPTCRADMQARGWDELDVLLVSGDAYVDHPSFGVALLGRALEYAGFRVGIAAQPDWRDPKTLDAMGRPRLFCGISAGCLDSMLAHYTAFRKKRHDDAYTPGGRAGARPNRACIVYSNLARQAFPGVPIVLGGIEASCRRLAHYDFWTDSIRRSILLDAKADVLVYGMADRALVELARVMQAGTSFEGIPGTAHAANAADGAVEVPSYEALQQTPDTLMDLAQAMERHVHSGDHAIVQAHADRYVVVNPPAQPLSTAELDALYDLPFTREAHPDYDEPIPALEMVKWSVTAVRGCGGGCSFCSLALHQGRRIRSRSVESILAEVRRMTRHQDWTGTVSDVGGPTANLWGALCAADPATCSRESCLFPNCCAHLQVDQQGYVDLLQQIKDLEGVTHVSVASGIRHDLALQAPGPLKQLAKDFVGGQLKVAPEHHTDRVLQLMRKTDFSLFERFVKIFEDHSRQTGRRQYIVPYIMSAFPGCTIEDMEALATWFRNRGWTPQQVQCFIPTPGTVATAMFYAGCDTRKKPVHVARSDREREDQHAILVPRRSAAGGRRGKGRQRRGSRERGTR